MRVLHARLLSFSPISTVRLPTFRRQFLRPPSQTLPRSQFSSSTPMESADVDSPEPKKPTKPWLVVGLGNPGKVYEGTRHNVGFELVDAIAEAEGISINTISHKALLGKGIIGEVPIILAKPQTFMNLSGNSVGSIVSYYKIPQKQVLVVYDDLDIPFGKLKMSLKGGHGGHNGMRNIIDHFKGSRDIMRLKVGIGRPPGKTDPVKFVLKKFNKEEREELNFKFQEGVEAVRILLLEGFNKSATFVNTAKPLKQLG